MERAFDAYHAIYRESGDSFPGINAATLALLAGPRRAGAGRSPAPCSPIRRSPPPADYYKAATRAEALLLLGRTDEVTATLAGEAVRGSGDLGGRSSTLRQLAMVAAHLGMGEAERAALLAPLAPPRVVHYCGHMFGAEPAAEARIRAALDAVLDEEEVGFAYGALACGADILAAEALLDRGAELHVVLPFEEEDFLLQSVLPGGAGWEARYRACRDRARRASSSPARWPISATPPNMAMPAARRWASPACAPSISPPRRCRSRSGTASPRTGRRAPAPTSPPGRRRANGP